MEQLKTLEKNMEKRSCRKLHKQLRDAMTAQEVAEKSAKICQLLCSEPWYQECNMIYAYYPLGNEVDCISFLQQALCDGKHVALPRTEAEYRMEFYEIMSLEDVEEGNFHVMEPKRSCKPVQPYESLGEQSKHDVEQPVKSREQKSCETVVIVPGVVFDRMGNRYGYGKGYYDRYFSRFSQPRRFALAFENQIEDALEEVLDTDVKMHQIYTENGPCM